MQDAAAAQGGWQADAVSHFLAQRSWAAISAFYASTVTGGVQLSSLGLTLVQPPSAPPPPPVAAPPLPSSVASQGAEQAASVQRSQQTAADANRVGVQTASAAAAAAAAAAAPAPQPGGRGQHRQRRTFKLHFAHLGPAFRGWQWVKGEPNTVEQTIREALQRLVDGRAAAAAAAAAAGGRPSSRGGAKGSGSGKGCGGTVVLSVAGRTDRGVSALGQVLSFYTWADVDLQEILACLNAARPGELRAWHVEAVPRAFHATFACQWRRYLYLLPLRSPRQPVSTEPAPAPAEANCGGNAEEQGQGGYCSFDAAAVDATPDVDPVRVAALLAALEGRPLDCWAFARDTPPGKDCVCRLLRARAWDARLPDAQRTPVLAVELVGDRFLRRMVRVLVATAFREALPAAAWFAGQAHKAAAAADSPAAAAAADGEAAWDAGALLRAAAARDRQGTAPPAPSEGLCFLEAGYSAFAD